MQCRSESRMKNKDPKTGVKRDLWPLKTAQKSPNISLTLEADGKKPVEARRSGAPSRGRDLAEGQTDQKHTRLSSGLPVFTTARQNPAGRRWLTCSCRGSHLSQIHTITQMSHLGISCCHIPTSPGAADWQEGDGV